MAQRTSASRSHEPARTSTAPTGSRPGGTSTPSNVHSSRRPRHAHPRMRLRPTPRQLINDNHEASTERSRDGVAALNEREASIEGADALFLRDERAPLSAADRPSASLIRRSRAAVASAPTHRPTRRRFVKRAAGLIPGVAGSRMPSLRLAAPAWGSGRYLLVRSRGVHPANGTAGDDLPQALPGSWDASRSVCLLDQQMRPLRGRGVMSVHATGAALLATS